jgi:threonine aldolase
MDLVQTNIVMIDTEAPALTWIEKFAGAGVKMVPFGPHRLRATTHLDVSAADINTALSRVRTIV